MLYALISRVSHSFCKVTHTVFYLKVKALFNTVKLHIICIGTNSSCTNELFVANG